jgi:peptide deformylase
MKLSLAYYGESILRKKCERVNEINEELRQLVNDMVETMMAHDGIGIAAPQVHHSIALFIINVPIPTENGHWLPPKLRVFINPKIIAHSEELWGLEEGCLSIPTIYGTVHRPIKIKVEATDLDGNVFIEEFVGYEARAIMHENDHINGVLFIDRLHGKERKELELRLREIKKKYLKK